MSVKKLLSDMRKANEAFGLIEDGDRIAVGLSGGKDSTLLLYCLSLFQKLCQNVYGIDFDIIGIHINLGFGEEDMGPLWEFLDLHSIEYCIIDSRIAEMLDLNRKNGKIQCSLCSKFKKGAVINVAKKLGINKVAFGHHADDAIETMFMNMIYGGRIATFDPKMHLDNSDIDFIRPFCLSFESEIKKTGIKLGIPVVKSGCPNDGFTKRSEIKAILKDIYHEYPMAKDNFLLALLNGKQFNIYFDKLASKDGNGYIAKIADKEQ